MNRDELKTFMPHREPMLLLDDAELVGEESVAHYTVKGDEFFLQGHFPGNPVVPGVILCEIMAQSCCVLIQNEVKGRTTLYSGIDKVRFRRQVVPGDTVEVRSHITAHKGMFYFVSATLSVGGKLATSGDLAFVLVDGRPNFEEKK